MFKVRIALLWLSYDVVLSAITYNLDPANWMRLNIEWLGERTLKEICLPGSHNSGMSILFAATPFAKPCNTLTQFRNVRRQLEKGIRFFDIRPVISGGVLRCGHYSKIVNNVWEGGSGHTIKSIVNNINMFNKEHNEAIFVRLSHTLNTDIDNNNYRPFNQNEWNRLFAILDKTEDLWYGKEGAYLPATTLSEFTKNGTAAAVVYIIDERSKNIDAGGRIGKGFFYYHSLHIYDQYSATDKTDYLYMDQIAKMKKISRHRYFLLSWTLTQKAFDAVMCPSMGKSIKDLATVVNKKLKSILAQVSNSVYPNVISIDYVDDKDLADIAMYINNKWSQERSVQNKG